MTRHCSARALGRSNSGAATGVPAAPGQRRTRKPAAGGNRCSACSAPRIGVRRRPRSASARLAGDGRPIPGTGAHANHGKANRRDWRGRGAVRDAPAGQQHGSQHRWASHGWIRTDQPAVMGTSGAEASGSAERRSLLERRMHCGDGSISRQAPWKYSKRAGSRDASEPTAGMIPPVRRRNRCAGFVEGSAGLAPHCVGQLSQPGARMAKTV